MWVSTWTGVQLVGAWREELAQHVDVNEVAAVSGGQREERNERTYSWRKKHSQQQARTDKEDLLRQTDRHNPRSGRVAAKKRRGT